MNLKSLKISEKALMLLKKSSKAVEIFMKASHFLNRSFHFSENVFKKPRYAYKIVILIRKKPPFL
jgi:hypothetical protein